MTKLKLSITDDDLASAGRFKISNPVLHKLQSTTGTLWRMCNDGVALEIMSPFRTTLLPPVALRDLHDWNCDSPNDCVLLCEIELELVPLRPVETMVKASKGQSR